MTTKAQVILDICKNAARLAILKRSAVARRWPSLYRHLPQNIRRKLDRALHIKAFLSTEKMIQNALVPFFKKQIASIVERLDEIGDTKAVEDAAEILISIVFDPDEWFDALVDATLPALARAMASAGAAQLVVLGLPVEKSKTFTSTKGSSASEWLADQAATKEDLLVALAAEGIDIALLTEIPNWMLVVISKELRNTFAQPFWREISETTGGDAERFIREGLKQGWSIRKIANEMKGSLGGNAYAKMRATRIARTEAGNVLNASRAASIDQLAIDIPEVPIRKSWLSVLGLTTRDSHANLDGVPADGNGLFNLNGVLVPWPSHVSLPARDRIHCLCSISTEFGMNEDDALLLIQEHEERRILTEEQITASGESE